MGDKAAVTMVVPDIDLVITALLLRAEKCRE
jgi:hypothetical protein